MPEASAAAAMKARTLELGFIGTCFQSHVQFITEAGIEANALTKTLRMAYNNGVETIRFPLYWRDVAPSKTGSTINYTWTTLDTFIAAATRFGFRLVPVISNAPDWALAIPESSPAFAVMGNGVYATWQSGITKAEIENDVVQEFANVSAANAALNKFQNAARFQIPSNNQDYADFCGVLAARYGSSGTFWSSQSSTHAPTVTLVAQSGSGKTQITAAVGSTILNGGASEVGGYVGWGISGSGIASGTKITGVSGRTLRLSTATTGNIVSTANAYTLTAPKVTHWQIWNEVDLTGINRVRIKIGSDAPFTVSLPIGVFWPQAQPKVLNVGAKSGSSYPTSYVTNPLASANLWATSFVDLAKKSRTAIRAQDNSAVVILGALSGRNPAYDDRINIWDKIDLIHNIANAKDGYDVLACNIYSDDITQWMVGGAQTGSKATILAQNITNSQTTITVKSATPIQNASYLIIGGTNKSKCEVVKVVSSSGNVITVTRGALGTTAKAYKKNNAIQSYSPGIKTVLDSKYVGLTPPKILVSEYGYAETPPKYSENTHATKNVATLNTYVKNKVAWNLYGAYQYNLVSTDGGGEDPVDNKFDYAGMIQLKPDKTLRQKQPLSAFGSAARALEVR